MPLNVDYYEGREQSYLKHLFLQKYLENAAYKLFQGRSPVFNFVDAFAGPWQNADTKSQSDTSFALALTTLENVRRILERIGRRDLKIRFRFCERNSGVAYKASSLCCKEREVRHQGLLWGI